MATTETPWPWWVKRETIEDYEEDMKIKL